MILSLDFFSGWFPTGRCVIGLYLSAILRFSRPMPFGMSDLASMSRSAYKMVPTAICPACGKKYWLLDEPMFEPGVQPATFPGKHAVTFVCCSKAQSVSPSSVVYRLQRAAPQHIVRPTFVRLYK
jgi:hypothetical protein